MELGILEAQELNTRIRLQVFFFYRRHAGNQREKCHVSDP